MMLEQRPVVALQDTALCHLFWFFEGRVSSRAARRHHTQMMCHAAPGSRRGGPKDVTAVPSISHTAGVPSLFCHRMSALPSPLKSSASLACQVGPGLARPGPVESTLT